MAELPTYNRAGIQYADLPRLVTEDIEMGAKSWGSISEKLDRLSSFAFKKAESQSIAQAKRFAAENPVTQEQIEAAKNPAGVIESFLGAFTGKGGTVYRQALSEAQGVVLGNELSLQATDEMLLLKKAAENGQVSYTDAKLKIEDMMAGYRATVSAFNPEAALKLQATMATAGNSTLKSIADIESKNMDAIIGLELDNSMQTMTRVVSDIYKFGDQFDPNTQTYVMADDMVDSVLDSFYSKAIGFNKPGYITKMNEFRRQAKISGLVSGVQDPAFASTPMDAYSKMSSGNMGIYQRIWDAMPDEDRQKVFDRLITETNNLKKMQDDSTKVSTEEYMTESYRLQDEAFYGNPSPTRKDEIRSRLIDLNAKMGKKFTTDAMLEAIKTGETNDHPATAQAFYALQDQAEDLQISVDQIDTLLFNKAISVNQATKLRDAIKSSQNQALRNEIAYYKSALDSQRNQFNAPIINAEKNAGTNMIRDKVNIEGKTPTQARIETQSESQLRSYLDDAKVKIERIMALLAKDSALEGTDLEGIAADIFQAEDTNEMLDFTVVDEKVKTAIRELLR